MYWEIKTDSIEIIETLLKSVIQKTEGHRLFTKRLDIGLCLLEIIEQKKEPDIVNATS
jgi:hypothetical protein